MATTCSARNAPRSSRRAPSLTSSGARMPTLNAWACMISDPPGVSSLARSAIVHEAALDLHHAGQRGPGGITNELRDRIVLERPQARDELQLRRRRGAPSDELGGAAGRRGH